MVALRSWMDDANCKGMDVNLWFPTNDGGNYSKFAIEVCESCDVRMECLEYGEEVSHGYGMFGGLSPNQREARRARLRVQGASNR